MNKLAVKVEVIESEVGWGQRTDDYMVCLTSEDALAFIKEFNSKNNELITPSWYMYAESTLTPIDLTEAQYNYLLRENRVWLSILKKKV